MPNIKTRRMLNTRKKEMLAKTSNNKVGQEAGNSYFKRQYFLYPIYFRRSVNISRSHYEQTNA